MSENYELEVEINPAEVITVPIDDTLSVAGEAADAKAVGDALADKADRSELATAIKVNDQAADNQGEILLTAEHVPMDDNGTDTVAEMIAALLDWTGEDIPVNGDTGADSIATAIAGLADADDVTALQATVFNRKTTSLTDFDNIDENGVYFINLDGMTAHKPATSGTGILEKYGGTGNNAKIQRFTLTPGATDSFGLSYTRIYVNGAWRPWVTDYGRIKMVVVNEDNTTDANGNLDLGIPLAGNRVLSAYAASSIVLPWVSSSDNKWHARILGVSGTPVANTAVVVNVMYMSVS